MAVKTSAERLRLMIAEEDERNDFQGAVVASNLAHGAFAALRVFLEAAHQHQYLWTKPGPNPCGCWICGCVTEMIRAFEEAT